MRIGFIGIGIMGKPMACNLVKAGYDVLVSNRNMEACRSVVELGAKAATYKEIAETCDVIITMLPNGPEVKEVMLGDSGVASMMHRNQIYIDCSSISPLVSKELDTELKRKGICMLDAPVSGGEPKAVDATLSFMVGGVEETFDFCKPILFSMGSSVVRCGLVGAGNVTKLANQVIVAANIAAVAEGLLLAKKADVDPEIVFEAIKGGLAGSTVMNAKVPMMLANNTKPGFKIDLHIKDLTNAMETAHSVGSPVPITAQVMEMMQCLRTDGFGQCDHSALSKYYEKLGSDKLYKEEEK